MSALGSALARAISALGGPQVATVVVVGGIAAGALGGGVIAAGVLGGSTGTHGTGSLAVYPCPNQGPPLTTVAGGQQLLVTGRLADGSWLRIHLPTPGRTEGWVEASPLTVSGSIDSLPVATCAAVAAVASPDVVPLESLTAIVNATPTPAPTPTPTATSTPTSGPTPTPNSTPTLASLAASTQTVSYDQAAYCPTAPKQVTISVKAAAAAGVATVTLYWRAPATPSYVPVAMTRTGGTAKSGTWSLTLDTTANGLTKAGPLSFYAIAKDAAGATVRLPKQGTGAIHVAVCANTGPAITSIASGGGSSMYSDPFGLGCTPTTTNITAAVADPQGVKSVTLFFRRPGTSWSSKPMNNTTVPPKWYANLDTLGDKIPTGTLSWYIKAVDGKNAASQSATVSTTIRLCKDSTPPVAGSLKVSAGTISGAPVCSSVLPSTLVQALPSDPQTGITSVKLWYQFSTGGTAHALAMSQVPGSGGIWAVTLDGVKLKLKAGIYELWAVAVNGTGGSKATEHTKITVVTC